MQQASSGPIPRAPWDAFSSGFFDALHGPRRPTGLTDASDTARVYTASACQLRLGRPRPRQRTWHACVSHRWPAEPLREQSSRPSRPHGAHRDHAYVCTVVWLKALADSLPIKHNKKRRDRRAASTTDDARNGLAGSPANTLPISGCKIWVANQTSPTVSVQQRIPFVSNLYKFGHSGHLQFWSLHHKLVFRFPKHKDWWYSYTLDHQTRKPKEAIYSLPPKISLHLAL